MYFQLSRRMSVIALIAATGAFAIAGAVAARAEEPEIDVIAETSGTSLSRSAPAGWRGATRSGETQSRLPRPTSSLTIRTYKGFGDFRAYTGDDLAYGVDVTAEIETCPDGNDRISALNIGGWLYEVDGDCSDYGRQAPTAISDEEQNVDERNLSEAVMRCDPATWRCRTSDSDRDRPEKSN